MGGRTDPFLEVTWNDDRTDATGYAVIDRIVGGFATGGTRMRAGLTASEVADLARGMSVKTGALDLPVGGAKGGIDFDPFDPEARDVLSRYVRAMRPLYDAYWTTAEDLGVPQTLIDEVFDEQGLGMSLHAAIVRAADPDAALDRVRRAYKVESDGKLLADLVGGYGVAQAALAAVDELGWSSDDLGAVIQGFGSMGGATARELARNGVRVVAVVDVEGCIVNRDGVDVERLLAARSAYGDIDRAVLGPGDEERPRSDWVHLETDLLIPAAVSYAITADNSDDVRARLVVEAANVATTAEAEARLLARDIPVIPDFVANAGAAGWAWWILLREVEPEPEAAFEKLSSHMHDLVPTIVRAWQEGAESPRAAATAISDRNLARHIREHGEVGPPRDRVSPRAGGS